MTDDWFSIEQQSEAFWGTSALVLCAFIWTCGFYCHHTYSATLTKFKLTNAGRRPFGRHVWKPATWTISAAGNVHKTTTTSIIIAASAFVVTALPNNGWCFIFAQEGKKHHHELWLCRTLVPVSPFYNLLLLEQRVKMFGTIRVHRMLMKSCVHLYVRSRRLARVGKHSQRCALLVSSIHCPGYHLDSKNAYSRCVFVSLHVIYDIRWNSNGRKRLWLSAAPVSECSEWKAKGTIRDVAVTMCAQ